MYDVDGKLLKQENIIDYTKENICGEYASLEQFIKTWTTSEKKEKIQELFRSKGIDLDELKEEMGLFDVDDFDFICHIAYDKKPLTRKECVENVKKRDIFSKYGGAAGEVLKALLDRYADIGIYEIEDLNVLALEPFSQYGRPSRIAQLFGGREGYLQAVKELEREIYRVA